MPDLLVWNIGNWIHRRVLRDAIRLFVRPKQFICRIHLNIARWSISWCIYVRLWIWPLQICWIFGCWVFNHFLIVIYKGVRIRKVTFRLGGAAIDGVKDIRLLWCNFNVGRFTSSIGVNVILIALITSNNFSSVLKGWLYIKKIFSPFSKILVNFFSLLDITVMTTKVLLLLWTGRLKIMR